MDGERRGLMVPFVKCVKKKNHDKCNTDVGLDRHDNVSYTRHLLLHVAETFSYFDNGVLSCRRKNTLCFTPLYLFFVILLFFLRLSSLLAPDTCEIDVLENMSKVSKEKEKQESRMKWGR